MKKIRLVITAMIGGLSMMAFAGAAMAQETANGAAAGGGYATDGREVGIVYLNGSEDGEAVELSVEKLDVLNAALATNNTELFPPDNSTFTNSTGDTNSTGVTNSTDTNSTSGGSDAPKQPTQPVVKTGADIGTEHILLSGASKAVYLVTGSDTVQFKKSLVGKKAKKATVPDAVTINNKVYKVTGIGAKAFSKCKAVKKLTVQALGLTAGSCKKCLKSSRVTTVKVPKLVKKAYKKIFVKKVCGKKVKVK
jgi:hypothetical protein